MQPKRGDCKWCNGTWVLLWCYNCEDWFCHHCLECHSHEAYQDRRRRMEYFWKQWREHGEQEATQ